MMSACAGGPCEEDLNGNHQEQSEGKTEKGKCPVTKKMDLQSDSIFQSNASNKFESLPDETFFLIQTL